MTVGVRDLKDNLSHYLRKVAKGERIAVTAHGRVIAELAQPQAGGAGHSRYDQMIAEGVIRPALRRLTEEEFQAQFKALRLQLPKLPKGTAQELIDFERGDR
jgi:antitoxin (DNA-binding transcriptional repressor) of toxin-antitoxin stability system